MTRHLRWRSARTSAAVVGVLLTALVVPVLAATPAGAVSPDVVISQIYGGGGNAGATFTHDFIELYNRGTTTVDLSAYTLQYGSAAGDFGAAANTLTPLTGMLPPGRFVLVQEAQGAGGTTPLPTPDITDPTPIAMSATAGKVALVSGTAPLGCGNAQCDATQLARVRDLVGYGNANHFEGTAVPTLSNTTAAIRNGNGADDTDNNLNDFAVGAPSPRNSNTEPPPPPPTCDTPPSHQIADVQGAGNSTPLAGQTVRVEGVVTGDFQPGTQLGGFFLQDDTPDANPLTSDGMFAAAGVSLGDVAVGDRVFVNGTAAESFGLTQLSSVTAVNVCGDGTIAPTDYDLPRPSGVTFEPNENTLLTFPEALTATEHFQLGRFGEVTVSADGRLFQPTERVEPGAPAQAAAELAARSRLLIDDGSNIQNPADVPFLTPDVLRIGDTASGATGVLSFGFGNFRLEPTAAITFNRTNPRPGLPPDVGGDIQIASFNTLNYFTTLADDNPNARGADNAEEFARQQAKEVEAIVGLDADILGLMEMENNGPTAIGNLVDALNAATAPGTYAFITEPAINPPNEFGGEFGTDAIKVAIVYRPAAVTPVGAAQTSADPIFDRPPLIQTFELAGGSEAFTIVVNHFKSKNCAAGSAVEDEDQGDGQSCFNGRRVRQATKLVEVLGALAPPNPIVMGDLNAYSHEDPVDVLRAAGYASLSEEHVPEADRYSFVFDGFSGELDHALASAGIADNVTDATIWHINADEPLILDYNTEFNPPGLYQPDAFRSSDHDPFLFGLALGTVPSAPPNVAALAGVGAVTVSWGEATPGGRPVTGYTVRALRDGHVVEEVSVGPAVRSHTFGDLQNGKTYMFEVVAVNELGPGPAGTATAAPFRMPRSAAHLDVVPVCSPRNTPAVFRVVNANAFPISFDWASVPLGVGEGVVAAGSETTVQIPRARLLPTILVVAVDLHVQDIAIAC